MRRALVIPGIALAVAFVTALAAASTGVHRSGAGPDTAGYGFHATYRHGLITVRFVATRGDDQSETWTVAYVLTLDGPGRRCDKYFSDDGMGFYIGDAGRFWVDGKLIPKTQVRSHPIAPGQHIRLEMPGPRCGGVYRLRLVWKDWSADAPTRTLPVGRFVFRVRR